MTSTLASLKVLFDANVIKNAVTHRSVLLPKTVKWGPITQTVEVAADVPNVYRGSTEEQTAWELEYLARIAELVVEGYIECYVSREIEFENWGLPRPVPLFTENAFLFREIKFHDAALPMERVVGFRAFEPKDQFRKDKERYLRSIRHPRFVELNAATGGSHPADTYHLWTAEFNDLDVFLTMDRTFKQAFANQKRTTSNVRVMLPWELVSCAIDMGIRFK